MLSRWGHNVRGEDLDDLDGGLQGARYVACGRSTVFVELRRIAVEFYDRPFDVTE